MYKLSQVGKDKLYLAIVGYWRRESNNLNIIDGIISIIFDYHKYEEWGKEGTIRTVNGNIIKFNYGNMAAYGTELVSSGKYEWSIKSTFPNGRSCQWIGISSKFNKLNTSSWEPYCMIWCNGCMAIQGNIGKEYWNFKLAEMKPMESWKCGDIITIKLDLIDNKLSFGRNGVFYGNENVDANTSYCLAISMNGVHCPKVGILSSNIDLTH